MKFDRQLRPATETSWVVSYSGKTIPRWRTAAILKTNISPSQWKIIGFSWNFVHNSRFWTGWTSRDQKWKSCIGQTPSSTERISCLHKNCHPINNSMIPDASLSIDSSECKGNYRIIMKLVHWPFMRELLHLVQRGWDWGTRLWPRPPYCCIMVRCSAVLLCPLKY